MQELKSSEVDKLFEIDPTEFSKIKDSEYQLLLNDLDDLFFFQAVDNTSNQEKEAQSKFDTHRKLDIQPLENKDSQLTDFSFTNNTFPETSLHSDLYSKETNIAKIVSDLLTLPPPEQNFQQPNIKSNGTRAENIKNIDCSLNVSTANDNAKSKESAADPNALTIDDGNASSVYNTQSKFSIVSARPMLYTNESVKVSDVIPSNPLQSTNGDLYKISYNESLHDKEQSDSSKNIAHVGTNTDLSLRSQEETLKIKRKENILCREHCKNLIQELMIRLLGQQDKVAVAVKEKHQSEISEFQAQIKRLEIKLSKVLDLATRYKKKNNTVIMQNINLLKSREDKLDRCNLLVQEATSRYKQMTIDFKKLLVKNEQNEKALRTVQSKLKTERLKGSKIQSEMSVICKNLDACKSELTLLRQEKQSLQLKLKKEHCLEINSLEKKHKKEKRLCELAPALQRSSMLETHLNFQHAKTSQPKKQLHSVQQWQHVQHVISSSNINNISSAQKIHLNKSCHFNNPKKSEFMPNFHTQLFQKSIKHMAQSLGEHNLITQAPEDQNKSVMTTNSVENAPTITDMQIIKEDRNSKPKNIISRPLLECRKVPQHLHYLNKELSLASEKGVSWQLNSEMERERWRKKDKEREMKRKRDEEKESDEKRERAIKKESDEERKTKMERVEERGRDKEKERERERWKKRKMGKRNVERERDEEEERRDREIEKKKVEEREKW